MVDCFGGVGVDGVDGVAADGVMRHDEQTCIFCFCRRKLVRDVCKNRKNSSYLDVLCCAVFILEQ